jgi:hypothetical protein
MGARLVIPAPEFLGLLHVDDPGKEIHLTQFYFPGSVAV